MREFEKDLTSLINSHGLENAFANTPDYILAQIMCNALENFKNAVKQRDSFYGLNPDIIKEKNMIKWHNYTEEKPKQGVEVIAYNKEWINADFNPSGQRVGFLTDDGFVSAFWWDYKDEYVAISKDRCEENPSFFSEHINNTEPEYWIEIPQFETTNKIKL